MPTARSLVDRFEAAATLGATLGAYAANRDVALDPIAEAIGLDPRRFVDFNARMGLDRFCRLLEALAVMTNDETFGLHLAETMEAGTTGIFGYGLRSAPTLGDAMAFAARHMTDVVHVQHLALTRQAGAARLQWTFLPLIVRRDQCADFICAMTAARLRDIAGHGTRRMSFQLERAAPRNPAAYRRAFSSHLTFDAPSCAIQCPDDLLATPNPRADPRLFRLMDAQCTASRRPTPGDSDLTTAVRLFILEGLRREGPTLDAAAGHVGMSERTLQRRLADSGFAFNDLIDDTRRELAARLLLETGRSVAAISHELGFSQPSAFTRSARRWFGVAPSAMRRRQPTDEKRAAGSA